MNFRASSDVSNLYLESDGRMNTFEYRNRIPGLPDIFLKRQGR